MTKVITFSRYFPKYHPKAGQPTYFVEQIYNSIYRDKSGDWSDAPGDTSNYVVELEHTILGRKHHTIRQGNRFKVGDKFSPRVWSGKPYRSPQIIIAPDIEVVKEYKFKIEIILLEDGYATKMFIGNSRVDPLKLTEVSKNDGLDYRDFLHWFQYPKSFSGQIICWNKDIIY